MTDEMWDFRAALANGSRRTPEIWTPSSRGDVVAGRVVAVGKTAPTRFTRGGADYIDIRVGYASSCGRQVHKGEWVRVICDKQQLAQMFVEDQPKVGDRVAVEWLGKQGFKDGTSRHVYRSVVEHEHAASAGEELQPWTT
jgi:hypothetical protein